MEIVKDIENLHTEARLIIETGRKSAYHAVNVSMVKTYWELGQLIVEEEQRGKERAEYGKYLISELAKRLQKEYGSGFSKPSLWNYRQFYKEFPILSALRRQLTWTHYKIEGDNPTIGILLCSEKTEAVVKYSVLNESQQLFASKYLLYLPSEAELKAELERERLLADLRLQH